VSKLREGVQALFRVAFAMDEHGDERTCRGPRAGTPPQPRPSEVLTRILLGNRVQQAVYVAAKLGIADELAPGMRTSTEPAEATGAHPDSVYRLLRVLASFGIFEEHEDGLFGLTPVGELLQTGPRSKRAFALWSGSVSYELFGALEHSVRTGEPAFPHLFGIDFFDYLSDHPDVGALFDEFVSRQTAPLGAVLAEHDLAGVDMLVDVGGGRGELLAAVLVANPSMRSILLDVPRVLDGARAVASGRVSWIARTCARGTSPTPFRRAETHTCSRASSTGSTTTKPSGCLPHAGAGCGTTDACCLSSSWCRPETSLIRASSWIC